MNIAFLLLICLVTLAFAAWAHIRIRSHTPSTRLVTHSALLIVGLTFAWVMAFVYTESVGLQKWLIFLSSFGVVHIPAAVILQLKQIRHRGKD